MLSDHKERLSVHCDRNISKCDECNVQFRAVFLFRSHLTEKHGMKFDIEKVSHLTKVDFVSWKNDLELANCQSFVMRNSSKNKKGEKIIHYRCNRSGHFITQSEGKRSLKSVGTRKIGNNCTAFMKTIEHLDGTVSTEYCSTHYGHEIEAQHINWPQSVREQIAVQLKGSTTNEFIIDEVRDNVAANRYVDEGVEQVSKIHLLEVKDIKNIAQAYGIEAQHINSGKRKTADKRKEQKEILEMLNLVGQDEEQNQFERLKSRAEGKITQLLSSVQQASMIDSDALRQVLKGVTQVVNTFSAMKETKNKNYKKKRTKN